MTLSAWTKKWLLARTTLTWIGFVCVFNVWLGYAYFLAKHTVSAQEAWQAELRLLQADNATLTERNHTLEDELSAARAQAETQRSIAPPSQRSFVYTIKKGDTLWDIARTYNVDENALMRWNGLTPQARLRPGDTITIQLEGE